MISALYVLGAEGHCYQWQFDRILPESHNGKGPMCSSGDLVFCTKEFVRYLIEGVCFICNQGK